MLACRVSEPGFCPASSVADEAMAVYEAVNVDEVVNIVEYNLPCAAQQIV